MRRVPSTKRALAHEVHSLAAFIAKLKEADDPSVAAARSSAPFHVFSYSPCQRASPLAQVSIMRLKSLP